MILFFSICSPPRFSPHLPGEATREEESREDNNKEEATKQSSPSGQESEGTTPKVSFEQDGEEYDFDSANKEAAKSENDPEIIAQMELIQNSTPETELEIALAAALKRKDVHIARLTAELAKLKAFVSKRKQTYKRKRKDEGAPTRALSAYNIFIQDRFARLAKENENALKSEDLDATLQRVPPANLVASTGGEWKELSAEVKAKYEER